MQRRNDGGLRVFAIIAAVAGFLGAALPYLSGDAGSDSQLLGSGTMMTVLALLPVALLVVGALAGRTAAGIAGGAGLFMFGLNALLLGFLWPFIDIGNGFSDEFGGGGISIGPGFVFSGIAAALGIVVFFMAIGQRPVGDQRAATSPTVGPLGALASIGLLVGLLLPPPDRHIGWLDYAFVHDAGEYSVWFNSGLVAFYVGSTLAVLVGFLSNSRWGLWLAFGGFVPLAWFAFAWLADIDDDVSGDRWSGAFKSEFHPIFGIACGAVILMLIVGFASSNVASTAPSAAAPPVAGRWSADPFGRYDQRYWDGSGWTDHVTRGGQTFSDAPEWAPSAPGAVQPLAAPQSPPSPNPLLGVPPMAPPESHDGLTVPRPGPARRSWALRFDDGSRIDVSTLTLIGREPANVPSQPPARLVVVADPGFSISKTHLAVGVDERGLWVSDRHSTNGSSIVGATGVVPLLAGANTPVSAGTTVRFGDRSFTVEA
jgi:hypothetical protein